MKKSQRSVPSKDSQAKADTAICENGRSHRGRLSLRGADRRTKLAIVREAYLRLVDGERVQRWQSAGIGIAGASARSASVVEKRSFSGLLHVRIHVRFSREISVPVFS